MSGDTNSDIQPLILVVEDHHETQVFLNIALGDDYIVHTATNAAEAFEKTAEHNYGLLLVDIALRDKVDGLQFVEQLRQQSLYATTPIIAMTAHQLREERSYYIEHGFDEYLPKPFFPQELFDTIERLLDEVENKHTDQPPAP